MSTGLLPEQFKELEVFVDGWALRTEEARVNKRLSSSMEEIKAYYEAVLPHAEAMLLYLNEFDLNDMPDDAKRLLYLCFSLTEASLAVEWWEEPGVTDGYDPSRWKAVHAVRPGFTLGEV